MENNLKLHLKLYYDFGGSASWLKDEIIKKRYDSFKYLIPVEKKEESNIVVEIYSPDTDKEKQVKYLTITSFKKIVGLFKMEKEICKKLALSNNECGIIYEYLKKTYFEKN